MFNSLFLAPVWFWASLFAAAILIPILVHLINLWRYRRVRWAAMDFLLKGFRKKQKKVWLTQLLLIVNRIAILLLAITFFGQIRCNVDENQSLKRGMVHLVIVDDSASMGQDLISGKMNPESKTEKVNCLERARVAVSSLAKKLSEQPGQKILVLRTSMNSVADQLPVPCDSNVDKFLGDVFAAPVSDLDTNVWQWIDDNADRFPKFDKVNVISDFRDSDLAREGIERTTQIFSDLTLVRCVQQDEGTWNLAIKSLTPEHQLIAAGVPFYLVLEVTNHSRTVKRNTKVLIRKSEPLLEGSFEFAENTSLLIPELSPGKTVQLQIPILANQSGKMAVEAELPDDDLLADNVLHQIIDVKVANQVLLLSENDNPSARYLSWLFQPNKSENAAVNSGFQSTTLSPQSFEKANLVLSDFEAVFLLSDDLNNKTLIDDLENYVAQGGLLIFVPGQFADVDLISKALFKSGQGLIKFEIASEVDLPDRNANQSGDIQILQRDLQQSFEGDSLKLLDMIQFYRKFIPPREVLWKEWNFEDDKVEALASIRGRATTPLVTRSEFGKGNVVCFLSPFDDRWNNWATNPTFLVLIYKVMYLYSPFRQKEYFTGQEWSGFDDGDAQLVGTIRNTDRFKNWDSSIETESLDLNKWTISSRGVSRILSGNKVHWVTARISSTESELASANDSKLLDQTSLSPNDLKEWNELEEVIDKRDSLYQGIWWLALAALLALEQWLAFLLGFHARKQNSANVGTGSVTQRRRHG